MKNYIKYIRRQAKHVQHMHAFVFAGSITFVIAAVILYSDYGFWHERYIRDDNALLLVDSATTPRVLSDESPMKVLSKFFEEAKVQFKGMQESSGGFLESKEIYQR